MKIAFIVTHFPALSETFVLNQITGLIERGHEVDIYADRRSREALMHGDVSRFNLLERTCYAPRLAGNPLTRSAKACFLAGRHLASAPRQVAGALNVFQHGGQAASFKLLHHAHPFLPDCPAYDIIHAHFGPNGIKAQALREIGAVRGKLITTFHGYDVNVRGRGAGRRRYADLFAKGDLFTANTRFTAEKLRELGCPAEKIARLPMGVDARSFLTSGTRTTRPKHTRLLTVARLVEPKGIEYALRALAVLVPRHAELRYQVVGDGPQRAALKKLCRELGLVHHVEFLGVCTQERVVQAYAEADLFLLPSIVGRDGSEEAQGLVLLEAQAMGLPVVASRIGGIPESLIDGVTGTLVPPRDPEALAGRLAELLARRETWADMGRAGRAFVEENFDLHHLNDRLVQLYKQVRNGGA